MTAPDRGAVTPKTPLHPRGRPHRWFYADLKAFKRDPCPKRAQALLARVDRIFQRQTGVVMLDRQLERLHANKAELLMVLDRPEIPLHTNGSENDVRCQVTRRQISGGTHADTGRDAFLALAKTCRKLAVSFRDYLGSRLAPRCSSVG